MRAAALSAVTLPLLAACAATAGNRAAQAAGELLDGFVTPPASARPLVWWHWLNGAISSEGILLDLEWMQRAGVGGVQVFSGAMPNNDGILTPPVTFMTAEWQRAFAEAVTQANASDMEVSIPTSAGWSQTGAPFVRAEDAMKKLVWSEIELPGGKRFLGALPRPSNVAGPFGTVPVTGGTTAIGSKPPEPPRLYVDSLVVAYRVPDGERPLPRPTVTALDGTVDTRVLFDNDFDTTVELPVATPDTPVSLRFEYQDAVTVRSVTAALGSVAPPITGNVPIPARLEVSDDGETFRNVTDIAVGAFCQNTTSFPAVTGRVFRIVLQSEKAADPAAALAGMAPGALLQPGLPSPDRPQTITLSQMALSGDARVNRFEEKAGFYSVPDYYAVATPGIEAGLAIDPEQVIEVTEHLSEGGQLDWTPPEGTWRVLRFGYSPGGHTNGPAEAAATGLEVDKLSAPRVRAYMKRYLEMMLGAAGSGQLRGIVSDSIEAGFSNWTDDILDQFERRRGYNPVPMLPTLTGRVVGSAETSDGFLYDFRRTITDLLAEAHYGEVAAVAHERGLKVYGEAIESGGRPILGDDTAMRRYADVPMGAMWTYPVGSQPNPVHVTDIKGAASVAHVYGAESIGAESMSSMFQPWAASPRDLKHVIDTEFALGVNRPSIHSSVHQPFSDRAPGLALWIFGQYFNRNESWAEQAKPWMDYIARLSWALSQGRYQADIAYFYGEEAPLVTLSQRGALDDVPTRHGYDFVNADALLSELSVDKGMLATRSGMRYRALKLGGTSRRMTMPVLRRIQELVDQGATVIGAKPDGTPSHADDPAAFAELASALWNRPSSAAGRVVVADDVDAALIDLGVAPDLDIVGGDPATTVRFLHREVDGTHLWFVANASGEDKVTDIAFRVTGHAPELWEPETGATRPLSYRFDGERTIVPIRLDRSGSALVVFRETTSDTSRTIDEPVTQNVTRIDDPWTVRFQPNRGAPSGDVTLSAGSWTDHSDRRVRFFSGTATYTTTVQLAKPNDRTRLYLSLGEVGDIAEVAINGTPRQTVWHAPYRVDITDAVVQGDNTVEVRVTNRWVNRLIGDAQPGAEKVTWTVAPVYAAEAPLVPSGLIGPVSLESES